ncbi:hypothetical protein [Brevundimonas sp.]|uniref:deazapurine DNA modification protein DpdA family protein n=1 Tax=Brevundimonas sp. TaxID=1871086 RepID=UPI0025C135F7|nr:hypothetical protein [Brevundimonas sp.]
MDFFVGLHHPGDAQHFDRACISRNRLAKRRKPVACRETIIDCAGFKTIDLHGGYPHPASEWAAELHRLWTNGVVKITVAVSEDYMCEPWMLVKTGMTIEQHQRLTVERYDDLLVALHDLFDGPPPFEVMPVLQGYAITDYLRHIEMYGPRLKPGMWVGVGSVCKRQGNVAIIEDLLSAIKEVRPDIRLNGFWREADRPAKPARAETPLQRRQHGVVVRRGQGLRANGRAPDARVQSREDQNARRTPLLPAPGQAPAGRQRLARSQGVRKARAHPLNRTGAAAAVRGVMEQAE